MHVDLALLEVHFQDAAMVTIHFVHGQRLTVDRTLDEVSRALGGLEQAEATIPIEKLLTPVTSGTKWQYVSQATMRLHI